VTAGQYDPLPVLQALAGFTLAPAEHGARDLVLRCNACRIWEHTFPWSVLPIDLLDIIGAAADHAADAGAHR
jgi:hypothetical protein